MQKGHVQEGVCNHRSSPRGAQQPRRHLDGSFERMAGARHLRGRNNCSQGEVQAELWPEARQRARAGDRGRTKGQHQVDLDFLGHQTKGMARSREPNTQSSEKRTMAYVGGRFAYAR